MIRGDLSITSFAGVYLAFALLGCDSNRPQPNAASPAGQSVIDHSGHAHSETTGPTDMEKMKLELAKLSPEDATSAEKQHVCPVTGAMLGTMGAPQKIDLDSQVVWICCAGCKDELLEQPDKFLAKLKKD